MEIVGAVASMVQCLCGQCCSRESISEQCSYLKKPQALLQVLEDKLKLLTAREADVRLNLRSEKIKRGMNPTAEVNLWLDNAQKIKAKLVSLEGEIEESESFLCGCFPNYYYRLKLGNKVSKNANLKVLHVSGCNGLRALLAFESLTMNLKNLVEISIENCEGIAEVIEGVEGDEVTWVKFPDIVLTVLQEMKLSGLPQLKHLYNGIMILTSYLVWRSMDVLT
ncbi:hypothetical protein CDL12_18716 [Handroanthus impetiginosus]|uniref:Disease resistance protein At4g27190-like leucine-rich repeats domain-containing protein n=1 Tax=Handroanthus impetiginosus TaxID=429701 RepID=A0A2G9GTU1_9LAMI|nr:hypothetical protein CDL12_18716 [Handroanthus impetiginosus]